MEEKRKNVKEEILVIYVLTGLESVHLNLFLTLSLSRFPLLRVMAF